MTVSFKERALLAASNAAGAALMGASDISATLYAATYVTIPVSTVAWAVTRFVLPELGFKAIGSVALTTVSRYAFGAALGSMIAFPVFLLLGLPAMFAKKGVGTCRIG